MSSTGQVKDAVRLAQKFNTNLYRYLINGLVNNLKTRSQLKIELEEYTRSSMKFFDRLYQIRDSKIPNERVQEEQINVFQEQVKRNDKLKVEVHKIQRRLWNLRANGQRVPMAKEQMILQGFPELCVSTSPDKVPLTVLCEKLIHKYNLRNEKSIKDLLKWAKEQSISRKLEPITSRQTAPRLPDFAKPAMIQAKSAEPTTESYDVTPVMSWEDASVQVEANLPMKEPLQPSTWSFEEKEEQSYVSSNIEESEEDYYPNFNREYPIFSWGELSEMFLKPRKRNITPLPEASTEDLKPDYDNLARLFADKSDAVPAEIKVENTKRVVTVPELKVEKPHKVIPVPELKVEKHKRVAPLSGSKVEKPPKVVQVPEFKIDNPHNPNINGELQRKNLTRNPANPKVQWSMLKAAAAMGLTKISLESQSCRTSTKPIDRTRQDSSHRENLTRNPEQRKIKWNLLKHEAVCSTKGAELQVDSKSQCTGLPMKGLASLKHTKPVEPRLEGSFLSRKVQWSELLKKPSVNMMVPSTALRNDTEKPVKETKNTHSLVGSDRPHVYENKIKRSQHNPKDPGQCSTSAGSLKYLLKRTRLLADLELKKQRLKNALNQQFKSKERKSSIHFYKVDNGPKAEKAIKATVPKIPVKYPPSIRRDTFLMSNDNQNSRKRLSSSSDDSDCSTPAAKRARHQPRIVLRLFRKGSGWNVEQGTD